MIINKKKKNRNGRIVVFAILANPRVKTKENKKRDKKGCELK